MNKAQVIGGSVFTAGLLAFSVWTFGPLIALGATAPVSPAVVTVIPEPTVTPTPTPTPTVAPVAPVVVVPAPVVEAPAPDYGIPVPWIVDSNPNSVEGGYYDTTQCASGAGYTAADGNQYCT